MTAASDQTALVSCMRNEGLFLLEWLAYHQTLGFDHVVVVSNDCTDGSDALLDALAAAGHLTHIRQTVPPGTPPQDAGMALVLDWARAQGVTWLLHIDSDEFLNVTAGDGRLPDLMANAAEADVVAIPWQLFGDAGVTEWSPGMAVLPSFTRGETGPEPRVTKSKCLFRAASFAAATDHNPRQPLVDIPVVVNPDGVALKSASLYQDRSSRFRPHDLAAINATARINHYAVKSRDLFMMKNDRGDGQGKVGETKYHLGSNWHRSANKNETEDRTILRHWPETQARMASLRQDPAIAAAENACFDWFTARKSAILTPEALALWTRRERPQT
ncbi:MAG: glycosyltransferase family 2 protein [Rhodobacterales bacterium]|nr:glycosyltransferase family 2 protein [Rhodobacterales bacterium]